MDLPSLPVGQARLSPTSSPSDLHALVLVGGLQVSFRPGASLASRTKSSPPVQAIAVPQNLPTHEQTPQNQVPAQTSPFYALFASFSSSATFRRAASSGSQERPFLPSGQTFYPDPSHLLGVPRPSDQAQVGMSKPASGRSEAGVDDVWLRIRQEARHGAEAEPFLASYLYSAILAHPTMEGALAFHLANKLANPTLLSTQLKELFSQVLTSDVRIQDAIRADLIALEARDPACLGLVHGLLNFKGYLAIQTYRVAHKLWAQGREGLALALANRISEIFHVEIHPAARIGKGLMLDHATGVVIGETACIGDNVSILHQVTLGGTGCMVGQRHPQVENGVLIGAGAKLLGPITVGAGSKIGAGSVVLEDVPANATVVGNPGRVLVDKTGTSKVNSVSPSETMEHATYPDWVI